MARSRIEIVAGVGFLALFATLIHLELRLGAQGADVARIRKELAAQDRDRAPAEEVEAYAAPPTIVRTPIDAETIAAIAAAVVQMQARQASAAAGDGAAERAGPRGLEGEKAVAGAQDVVSAAIARGHLTREDILQARAGLAAGKATPEEIDAIRSKIAMAINAQKLVPEDRYFVYP